MIAPPGPLVRGVAGVTWKGHLYVQAARLRDALRSISADDRAEALDLVDQVLGDLRAELARERDDAPLPF